jgi:hypothetical protein
MRPHVPQYLQVDGPSRVLHCPMCGKIANPKTLPQEACNHLAFVYLGEPKQFIYRSQDFIDRTKKVNLAENAPEKETEVKEYDHEHIEESQVKELLIKAGFSNYLTAIEITIEGFSTPGTHSDVYGFDFSTYTNPEDDEEEADDDEEEDEEDDEEEDEEDDEEEDEEDEVTKK